MERLTEKFKDGRNILRKGIADIFHVGFGRFFEGEAVDKLAEYEDLEEQGKLLKLPCVVGDTVYLIDDIEKEFERVSVVTEISIEDGNEIYIMISDGFQSGSSGSFGVDDFGKTVFLTQQEAEQALKEMEGKNGN